VRALHQSPGIIARLRYAGKKIVRNTGRNTRSGAERQDESGKKKIFRKNRILAVTASKQAADRPALRSSRALNECGNIFSECMNAVTVTLMTLAARRKTTWA